MFRFFSNFGFGSFGQSIASPENSNVASEIVALASLSGGGYALAYETQQVTYVQIFDQNGERVGEPIFMGLNFVGNFDLVGTQDGGFIVVYKTDEFIENTIERRVIGQLFDVDGDPSGNPFTVFKSTSRFQQLEVTLLENGDVVFAWVFQDGPDAVLARVLSPTGEPRGDVFTISQDVEFTRFFFPQLDALAGGGFVASWSSNNEVYAQAYDDNGKRVGPVVSPQPDQEFIENRFQSVVGLPDGNFMLVWNENLFESQPARVKAAIYAPDGTEIVPQFRVDSSNEFELIQPTAQLLDDGTVLIAWRYNVPGEGPNFFQIGEIRAQRVSADGQLTGEEFQVDDGSDLGQLRPLIASFGTDDFVVAWNNFAETNAQQNVQLRNLFSVTDGDDNPNVIAGTAGVDFLRGMGGADILNGGIGEDGLDGGSNVDTAVFKGNFADYTVTQTDTGVFEVVGPDGTDTLTTIEFLQFDDQTVRLLRGEGITVDFETADPTSYAQAVTGLRDFDGNDLGGDGSWLRIGAADVNGDGDGDQILVNDAIGRFATVGTAQDGLVYFDDHSWAGETRVAGIYIDPFVANGSVEQGSEFDSQARFQNDLQIENINRVLGSNDYNGDGVWEVYLALTDGTAYLQALMHADGNIRFANYQSEEQVRDYLTANGFGEETFGDWFGGGESSQGAQGEKVEANALLPLAPLDPLIGSGDNSLEAASMWQGSHTEFPSEFFG